jgi:hypothetical protein
MKKKKKTYLNIIYQKVFIPIERIINILRINKTWGKNEVYPITHHIFFYNNFNGRGLFCHVR